jgi:hypothetical protein
MKLVLLKRVLLKIIAQRQEMLAKKIAASFMDVASPATAERLKPESDTCLLPPSLLLKRKASEEPTPPSGSSDSDSDRPKFRCKKKLRTGPLFPRAKTGQVASDTECLTSPTAFFELISPDALSRLRRVRAARSDVLNKDDRLANLEKLAQAASTSAQDCMTPPRGLGMVASSSQGPTTPPSKLATPPNSPTKTPQHPPPAPYSIRDKRLMLERYQEHFDRCKGRLEELFGPIKPETIGSGKTHEAFTVTKLKPLATDPDPVIAVRIINEQAALKLRTGSPMCIEIFNTGANEYSRLESHNFPLAELKVPLATVRSNCFWALEFCPFPLNEDDYEPVAYLLFQLQCYALNSGDIYTPDIRPDNVRKIEDAPVNHRNYRLVDFRERFLKHDSVEIEPVNSYEISPRECAIEMWDCLAEYHLSREANIKIVTQVLDTTRRKIAELEKSESGSFKTWQFTQFHNDLTDLLNSYHEDKLGFTAASLRQFGL